MQKNAMLFNRLSHQFRFTVLEVLFLVCANGVLVLGVLASLILDGSHNASEFAQYAQVEAIGGFFEFLNNIARFVTGDVATMILWAIIGSFVYSFVVGFRTFFDDTVMTFRTAFLYVHPRGFQAREFIEHTVIGRLLSISTLFLLVVSISALSKNVIPYVFSEMKILLQDVSISSLWVLVLLVLFTSALHIIVVLIRLEMKRYRLDELDNQKRYQVTS